MIKKVLGNIEEYRMLEHGDRVVVAVSGGPDSVALLDCLDKVAAVYSLKLIIAHLNHGLRGEEAWEDQKFVNSMADARHIPFEAGFVDIPALRKEKGGSVEELARAERYRFLNKIATKHAAQKIALGHHLHDQAETVLMNLIRGAGGEGLRGMLPVRGGVFIRPMINLYRSEIMEYLSRENLHYQVDRSNNSEEYVRNRIRKRIIPELKTEFNPKVEHNLYRLSEIIRREDDYLQGVVKETLERWDVTVENEKVYVLLADLSGIHEALQNRVIKTILQQLSPANNGIQYDHVQSVLQLSNSDSPHGMLNLPFQIKVMRKYGKIVFSRGENQEPEVKPFCYEVKIPGRVAIGEAGLILRADYPAEVPSFDSISLNTAYIDYDKIKFPMVVRNIRPGDRIEPLGMKGSQKIKKVFIDHKIDLHMRKSVPLVADDQSLIWIPNLKMSERVKVTATTMRVVKIEII